VAGIPYLSRVPVLGWLFKQKTESVAKQELLIFLTPNIVKKDS
jgi:type IV pilus assembly protein PilQ